MSNDAIRRFTAGYLAWFLAANPLHVYAAETEPPGPDVTPPQIVHAPLIEFAPGMPHRIQATVSDEGEVADVFLLYRSAGEREYRRMRMARTAGTDIYWADLPDTVGPKVEYIIQASDVSGNRVLGQLFDPYVTMVPGNTAATDRLVAAPATAKATTHERGGGDSGGGFGRWVWIGLGVAAVAVLAGAAAGGGGGDSGGGGAAAGSGGNGAGAGGGAGTGTVTITAPVP
jgi:hypothetical protein